ncbi:MAG TPA: hypothetical protein VJ302_07145 [Blastocatellia bacterium]|nr:hypothetical protein [Blastocatellia bacterium]
MTEDGSNRSPRDPPEQVLDPDQSTLVADRGQPDGRRSAFARAKKEEEAEPGRQPVPG